MNVLVVGSGAREHALLWTLRRSHGVDRLLAAPGNAGIASLAENVPVAATDVDALVRLVEEREIDLTVVGPEAPLVLGLADRLREAGRRVVGPSAAAARLEGSKAFAKNVMTRAGVPTASFVSFADSQSAIEFLAEGHPYPLVVKADGLAAGKGVWVCRDEEEARAAVTGMMVERRYGSAGSRIVIEEGLRGPEISLIALVDGRRAVALPLAQDHKRLLDGDVGPNTGGMGAYAPVPFLGDADRESLLDLAVRPVVEALARSGTPYRGFLFAGLMLTEDGPRVLEYNCRLGDPEAQVLLPLLRDDLLPWLEAMADGSLPDQAPRCAGAAVGVVLAAPGYPDLPEVGTPIHGLDDAGDVLVFHAGTARDAAGRVVTAGGRVLTVVGMADTVPEAARTAYGARVSFEGMQRRCDIGRQAMIPSPPSEGGGETRRPRIAVLASGAGSNLQALIEACRDGAIDAEIVLVASHRVQAGALRRAEEEGIPRLVLPLDRSSDRFAREPLEETLLAHLCEFDVDLVVLAGWMLILSPRFLAGCPCPLLNVHPALLPDGREPLDIPILRGAHAVRDAIALRLPYTGVSVHHVTEEVDAGPVVRRETVPIERGDDEDSLYRRIKPVEHRLLREAVRQVLDETRQTFSIPHGGVHA
jgi:phosphoribosylamine--glycine ligase